MNHYFIIQHVGKVHEPIGSIESNVMKRDDMEKVNHKKQSIEI